MALQSFLDMLQGFVERRLSVEDFISQYGILRNTILTRAYDNPRWQEEDKQVVKDFRSGRITKDEFRDRFARISQEYWPEEYIELLPYTPIGEAIMSRLVVAIDRFDAPEGYGDDSINEDELREIAADILCIICDELGKADR